VRLVVFGVLFVILALLSVTASEGAEGKRRVEQILMGTLMVAGVVYLSARAGMPWLIVGLVALYLAARRLANRGRPAVAEAPPPSAARPPMSREEAYQVLGLEPGATPERIREEYRRLMKKMHPDQGGTTYLAARINEARDVLLGP
jgi:DnaJ family protein C protein 19